MYLAGSRYPEDDFPNEYPFLAKYDQDGVEVWSKSFEHDGSTSYFSSMAVDAADSLALVGVFNGSMNLGGDDLVTDALVGSGMLPNGFVARFTADGDHIHSGQFGGTIFDGGNVIAPLANGDLLVGGWLSGVANVGGQTVTADEEDGSAFVARLDASLEARWVELAATVGATQAITSDSDEESFWAVGDFGGSEYLVEYSASGMAAQVASTVSGALVSTSAAVDPLGGLWIAGMFTGELDLGNGNQFDGGPAGVCLVRLDRAASSR
jgi:hypothetical protein